MTTKTTPTILPTTVVGSYPQPAWLVDHALLAQGVPRTRLRELWRVAPEQLQAAQDDATKLAIQEMERAGIDIITDGEIRRESYSNRFANSLDGIDDQNPAVIRSQNGLETLIPRVVGKITRVHSVEVEDFKFLKQHTDRLTKVTLPGPFTMGQQAKDEFYRDEEAMVMDFAAAVNAEALALQAAGADFIQLDEPWLRHDPEAAKRYAVKAINRALQGVSVPTIVHLCFGYAAVVKGQKPTGYSFLPGLGDSIATQISIEAAQPKLDLGVLADLAGKKIMLGVLDLGNQHIETAEQVAVRIRAGLKYVKAEQLIPAPDCGMKYLSRDIAYGKLCALSQGAQLVRAELGAA
jgi:5-methyltetrahydropteroyltriglutamate--homocysteine methyltransferase